MRRAALLVTTAVANALLLSVHGPQPYARPRSEQFRIRCQLPEDTTPVKKEVNVSAAAATIKEIMKSESKTTGRFFMVQHFFDREQTEQELEYAGRLQILGRDVLHAAGFCRVGYMPAHGASHIFCLWECKDNLPCKTFDEMRKALDPGPLGDAQVVHQIEADLPGASIPASAFSTPRPPEPFASSTGSFFWVRHAFLPGGAALFWAAMEAEPARFASPYPDRVHTHCVLPTGTSDDDALFSVWETREPMHAEEFAGFINGPQSPAPPTWFGNSEVHQLTPNANPFPAVFGARSFMASVVMPLMDAPMPSLKESKSWLRAPDWLESDW
jgi:hypothetical protein